MQNIYDEVNSLDKRCYEEYRLSEDILMEHASLEMMNFINKKFQKNKKVLIVCGAGNNGADGIALARLLYPKFKVSVYLPFGVKSQMAKIQLQRIKALNIKIASKIKPCDIVVDCLFGSGLNRVLNEESSTIIKRLNSLKAYKIACDIPSGITNNTEVNQNSFYAHTTITMGALQKSLFTDSAKEYVGNIKVANLGVQRKLYEKKSSCFLLEKKDLKLPLRDNTIANKGTYGHLCVVVGEKKGAGLLCAKAGFSFGCGLITVISKEKKTVPSYIMQSKIIPKNTTSLCIGMGLGRKYDKSLLENDIPKVIDADLFYDENIIKILTQKNIVLTPHPKEFCSLLKITQLANISTEQLQNNRFKYVELFCEKYKNVVLLLKGTNVLISQKNTIYVNPLGSSVLSKGGSGDVLSGLIGSLLAQGYSPLDATINASLAHTLAASHYKKHNYSMTPKDLIKEIKKL
ncbi:MAG: bifunctional ADP-dependent NAD(P)H-hydrate dehydratase/NAD(P)H-hydrate epimerase [Arcobacter sp.]|nr:MAG: bifunctional ADP-dependent NAD(P)H-hydrate dehydratase/NAD(P)H-hydrate epimerase [Arcobacter sp.]